jgi:MOSC domain-containing protein YiiM
MRASILSVQTGRTAPLGPNRVPSGFVKTARMGRITVAPLGLDGDEQADLTVHGGNRESVYGYPSSRHPLWAAEFPALATQFIAGAMGENLTIAGLDEKDVCVGDVQAIGSTLLQVCQPRLPCFKLSLRHNNNLLPKAMFGWASRAGIIVCFKPATSRRVTQLSSTSVQPRSSLHPSDRDRVSR